MIIALQTLIFFRQSLLTALDRLLQPYYRKFSLVFSKHGSDSEDDDSEEQVFAEFDDEKGVVFYPPMYAQRYAAVSDCLMDDRWAGKLEKVVDLGYHDMTFIKYLKEVPGVHCILGVDIESIPLRCSSDLLGCEDYAPKRENPLQVTLFQGNAADPDYRLIGCDAVVAIEMIEHMLPHDLDRLVHTVFGFIKPRVVIFTTPNADFNTLFKSLEKNGLRRLDHFFEWTREQFHDWCSNIVVRYPQYTVSCKGVGPGPPGTLHYGCCSQLALFISKDYQKQQDLNLNSLALVANAPSQHTMTDMIAGWDSPMPTGEFYPPNVESLTEVQYSGNESCVTIGIASPTFSIETMEYSDKTSQCNIDREIERNFLMFNDEEMCFSVLIPRRKLDNRVYEMEDVTCRLNCTTYQVKKFSKTTQNLMAKNKLDSLAHTREVVDEIRHLTNMLNFNKESSYGQNASNVWYNINWGDNAPYWNQYYKIVREYNYPFEIKSDECRVLDLISDEINKLIDIQYDEEYSVDVNKLEIPLSHLMKVVNHITDDTDKVKDLLEWNGYEIRDNVVVHCRIVLDNASVASREEDWPDNDTVSDWDGTTDVHSTTVSDGSTIVPDYHGRALRRALDKKVRSLRTMLSADEDITTELDRVVCRLMKLALKTSKSRQTPPPTRWMQCKLLDLLTLTEKAIARRKRHFIESFPLRAIAFDTDNTVDIAAENGVNMDKNLSLNIMSKYQNLMKLSEVTDDLCDDDFPNTDVFKDSGFDSSEFNKNSRLSSNFTPPERIINKVESKLERTQAWVEEDNIEVVTYPYHHSDKATNSPSEHSMSNDNRYKRFKKYTRNKEKLDFKPSEKSNSKLDKHHKSKHGDKEKTNSSKLIKKVLRNKSSSNSFIKYYKKKIVSHEYGSYVVKPKRKIKEHKKLQSTASKPIPGSIIELCHPELNTEKSNEELRYCTLDNNKKDPNFQVYIANTNVAATEESLLVDIVMDDMEETIALRRTIGTDAEFDPLAFEQESIIQSVANVMQSDTLDTNSQIICEDLQSQTIFLYDINEPSTSKGVRHVSMDVQCGPDTVTPACAMLSPATSLSKVPKVFSTGIEIGDSLTNLTTRVKSSDFSTSTNYNDGIYGATCQRIKSSRIFTKGIKIGDSLTNLANQSSSVFKKVNENLGSISPILRSTRGIRIEDSLTNMRSRRSSDFGTCTNKYSTQNNMPSNANGIKIVDSSIAERKSSEFLAHSNNVIETNATTIPRKSLKFFTGIKIGDFLTNVGSKQSLDFGTSTDNYNTENQTNSPNICPIKITGIKLGDSLTDIRAKRNCGFNTTSDDRNRRRTLSPTVKSFGLKIKNSDTNIKNKTDCAPAAFQLNSEMETSLLIPLDATIFETKLLKPISSGLKMEDSGSEFYGSCSPPKSQLHFNTSLNEFHIKPSVSKEVGDEDRLTPTKHLRPKLSRGGVHVHSYREKQISEDIVYQGEWQRYKPKARKKIYNPIVVKKVTDVTVKKKKVNSKEKLQLKKPDDKTEVNDQKKQMQARRFKFAKVKQDIPNKTEQIKKITPVNRDCLTKPNIRTNRNVIKVASKITIGSVTSKTTKNVGLVKRPPLLQAATLKEGDKLSHNVKNYIPSYLIRRKTNIEKKKLNQNIDSLIKINKDSKRNCPSLMKQERKDITDDLFKLVDEPRDNISYVIFRNELDNITKSASDCQPEQSTKENTRRKNSANKRSSSPASQNSSTCSTPDSVATVRAVSTRSKVSTRRHSTSSNKSSIVNSESESNTPARNRKFTKRGKGSRKTDDKDHENKENIPESSQKYTAAKESIKNVKSAFMGRSKNVFMAQFADNTPATNSISKHKTQTPNKSNIKIPTVESNDEKKRSTGESISKKASRKSNNSLTVEDNKNQEADNGNLSHFNVVLQPYQEQNVQENSSLLSVSEDVTVDDITYNTVSMEWLDSANESTAESTESTILAAMRQLVEERLGFITSSANYLSSKSEMLQFYQEVVDKHKFNESVTPTSFNTLIGYHDNLNSTLRSDADNNVNLSFDITLINDSSGDNITPTATDMDLLSFKSITSASRFSEYFLADNEFDNEGSLRTPNSTSVRDIFERKDQSMNQNPAGALAVQAFSGFSMNAIPVAGDQPDYVNLIDSETGSLAMDIARQATSEELFVSGRSSESYESCIIDEEAVVPNWLFNIISQQHQSVAEEDIPPQLLLPVPLPMPMAEPLFDVNGNVLEPSIGVGAGAGDGRGMHSDHSQDSSGRGTSLSSSETSSGQQSEAILIDPSAFAGQFELMHESIGSSIAVTTLVIPLDSPDSAYRNMEGNETATLSTSRNGAMRNRPNPLLVTSDVEADVSSLDTDVPDSSDN